MCNGQLAAGKLFEDLDTGIVGTPSTGAVYPLGLYHKGYA